ncbi:MAG TPA: VWA domain-containing protein, partial [Candidatus Binatus sp.]|nr:VWA domain-containing protein [Candidatus Binatus sp.]
MTNLFDHSEFARPEFLWLLLILPILWFRFRDRRLAVLIGRTLIVAILVLTLADPQSTSEQAHSEERLFAYDLSQSIPESMHQWMISATKELAPTAQDRILVFGGDAKQAANVNEALAANGAKQLGVDSQKTSLENFLSTVLALPNVPHNVYLFTDGWETQGNIERLLPQAAAAGIKINPMVPVKRPAIANVAVTKLLAPTQGNSGDNLNLKVVIDNQNDHPVDGTLTLSRNGQPFKTENIKMPPGSQALTYQTTLSEGALTAFQANFSSRDPAADRYPADNHALAWVTVRSKAKILLVNGHSGAGKYLDEILKRQGFDVTVRNPEAAPAPAGYKVVIFNNAERDRFPAGYLAAVERNVADGNGFVILGADNSFGLTSYRQTPIEKLLPVIPKEPPKPEEKNRAVVLVIDKSGSMRDDNRIVYAKEAAKAVARQLKDNDLLGVVGFDDSPFVVVYLETMARLRGVVDNQIDRLKPGGQTYFLPALNEARR